ncbi:hypothetical protein [Vibrio splendidus]|uniref:hypothetical protein n=1 Tax=Vibrio splendidus TaxID=29497 RepID=UPI000C84E87C|nr:hypothetical protein [Vibrio splendidus]PMM11206.1 hypothetical protein BCT62_01880 [Vibrio splendidus]PMN31032.1 hypothetical protein BCT36_06535 [Vibrio splendidus]
MSFFKKLFGLGDNKAEARILSHPRDLRAGDIIKFRYSDQSDVSGQQFEVFQINTYIYSDLCYPELVLKDRTGNIIFMMVEEEDGEEYLALSKKVDKARVSDLLTPDDIDAIKAPGAGTSVTVASKPEGLDEWLVKHYREVDDRVTGAFVKGDARDLSDEELKRQERFSSHVLEDSDGEFAIEIEFYETGEMEVSATVYQEISEIEEMWPRANG